LAYEIDTAADYADLRTRLVAFLTTNADLVAANQQWSVAWTGSGRSAAFGAEDIVLAGSGLSGDDQIFVGLRSYPQPSADRYNYCLRGLVGLNPSANNYDEHVNVSTSATLCCGNFPMPYWFIANGRRFIVVVKVSTVYQVAYGGFVLPYAPPNIYPYPLAVGGCTASETARWSDTGNVMSHFADPGPDGGLNLMQFDNSWRTFVNWTTTATDYRRASDYSVAPWHPGLARRDGSAVDHEGYRTQFINKIQTDLDGCYPLVPATLLKNTQPFAMLGVLQGVYHVPGFNLSAETILNQGGVQYLCIPNVYREGNDFYAAYALDED